MIAVVLNICWLFAVIVFFVLVVLPLPLPLLLLLLLLLLWSSSSSSTTSLTKVDLVKWMLKSKCSAQAARVEVVRRFFEVLVSPLNSGK